jgi:GNAT superfamily N-acetyltransferase
MPNYVICAENITREEVLQAAVIHRREMRQGFLGTLGDRALEMVFSFACASCAGVLLIAKDGANGPVCGFALGALNTGAFYRDFLVRKSFSAVIALFPKLFSLKRIIKICETLVYPLKKDLRDLPKAELIAIALAEQHRGAGLAQLLFHAFSSMLSERGIAEFKITTGEALLHAQRFYEKLGAKRIRSIEVYKGRKAVVYTYFT